MTLKRNTERVATYLRDHAEVWPDRELPTTAEQLRDVLDCAAEPITVAEVEAALAAMRAYPVKLERTYSDEELADLGKHGARVQQITFIEDDRHVLMLRYADGKPGRGTLLTHDEAAGEIEHFKGQGYQEVGA